MLKTVVKKEILENIFSYRFPLFAVICLALIPLGMYVSQVNHAKRLRDYSEQVRLTDEAASAITIQDVMAGTVTVRGFRPPALLSIFAQGFEGTLPRFYEFTQDGYRPGESSSGEESLMSVQGKVDFVFLVQMVLSLIALLFASDAISGEKEAGTLRAMLSNRLPRDTLLLGKVGGGYLSLWVPFLLAFGLGAAILVAGSVPIFGGGVSARLLLILVSTSLFILTYYVIGLAVSTASSKARTSLVSILILWTLFQLIIPKLGDMVAALIHPVKTETEVSLSKSLLARSIDTERAKDLGRQYDLVFAMARPGAADDENSPERKKWDQVKNDIMEKARERKNQEVSAIEETYQQEKRRQQDLAVDLSLVSPSAAFGRIISDICGTGEVAKADYLQAVKAHQKALDNELFSKVKRTVMIHPAGGTTLSFSAEPVDAKKLPKFSITPSPLADVFKANVRSIISLLFWLVAPFAFAYIKFSKYDVR